MGEKQKLIFWEASSINKAYWNSWKNILKKTKTKIIKQINKKDIVYAKKFKIFCEKKWFVKDWVWDYEALVEKWKKGIIKNLSLKDIAKMYEVNKKNIKKYFTLVGKKELSFIQKIELKNLREKIIF